MNRTDSRDGSGRKLTTADLAAAGRQPPPDAVERQRAEERVERERQNERTEDRATISEEKGAAERIAAREQQHRADERTAAGEQPRVQPQNRADFPPTRADSPPAREREKLEALFPQDVAERYRSEWAAVQSSFVDDPKQAAARGDELVAQVMKGLAESFAHEREQLEQELSRSGEASTETLRIGFRRYRSFFERLLAL